MKRLIEQWFPGGQVGAESLRERGAATALPPINFMHVWWARRPLTASRAAILLSLLPAWPRDTAASNGARSTREKLQRYFPGGEAQYHTWVLRTLGILGDTAAERRAIEAANARGERLSGKAYAHARAFTTTPDIAAREIMGDIMGAPVVLDPFAGGGSIPLESIRLGLPTIANELNPVATAVLFGTVSLPLEFRSSLLDDIKQYGKLCAARVEKRLEEFFPQEGAETIDGYISARTVPCPTTGYPTPLAPDYWLTHTDNKHVAVELIPDRNTGLISTRVHTGEAAARYGDRTTYKRDVATSIWTGETFDGDYIEAQSKDGNMRDMLLAVVIDRGNRREFRAPTERDLQAIQAAKKQLAESLPGWEAQDLVPNENLLSSGKTNNIRRYGAMTWAYPFAPRQFLANITILEELRGAIRDAIGDLGQERGRATALYLALSFDRCIDYNSSLSSWDSSRNKVRNNFDRHDFAMKWSFAEFDAARQLVPWVVGHTITNYTKLLALFPTHEGFMPVATHPARVVNGSAAHLSSVPDESVDAIITDPPYYDNVQYAECSDFFYVWMKRALRDTWPEVCGQVLTDKEREAVANPALFRNVATRKGARKKGDNGKTAAELADARYEQLLTESFDEAARVLKPDGIMTVMFTHKRIDAWDTLGSAILNAGFTIESSWPVATESENSLHQAKKNAASSTIFLTCRKRVATETAFWPDLKDEVTRATEESVKRFAAEGMTGVDLTLACYGPALSVISKHWPVYTGDAGINGEPIVIQPDVALELARAKVAEIKKRGLLGGRNVDFDRPTDWWLIAWFDFKAREFSSGEAIKLCQAMHLDLEDLSKSLRLVDAAKGSTMLLSPAQRRARNAVNPSNDTYKTLIDSLHALMLVYSDEGLAATRNWLDRTKMRDNERFTALVRAAINALPRVRSKGKYIVEESATLESIRATLFDDVISAPKEDAEQLMLV